LVASNILEEEEVPKLHTNRELEHFSLKIIGRRRVQKNHLRKT
jgi:hypothetical protein